MATTRRDNSGQRRHGDEERRQLIGWGLVGWPLVGDGGEERRKLVCVQLVGGHGLHVPVG